MIMPFGKYRNKDLEEIPSDYLWWIAENVDDNEELVSEVEDELRWRSNWNKHFVVEKQSRKNS